MSKTFSAILIDPLHQSITGIEVTASGSRLNLNDFLSFPGHECLGTEAIGLGDRHYLFVDGEAALEGRLPRWTLVGTEREIDILGRGLIVRSTPAGNNTNVTWSADKMKRHVRWHDRAAAMAWRLTDGDSVFPQSGPFEPVIFEITEHEFMDRLGRRFGAS